ncbi:MAG: O-antigen ligase family protein [Acidimicrobiales bacterium]|nr:O-antigen ligase family protein [Acidimicrobiales bacterium]
MRRLPGHWPLTACIGLFPLWWALGAAPFIWLVFAVPLAFRLTVHRRPIRVPRGFGAWLVWIGFVVLSYFALRGGGFAFAYFLRLANYASVTVFFLAIVSAREDEIPTAHVVRLMSAFWMITVAGGWLGVLLPNGELPSTVGRLLPARLANDPFVSVLVTPSFAQVHDILGYPLGRPKAPFVYTNDWGSAYALLLPFFFMWWLQSNDIRKRSWAYLILLASLVPVFVSLNRGLWVSLGIALVYAASRSGDVARLARRALVTLLTIGMLLIVFTPVGRLAEARAENDHSSEGRGRIYAESLHVALESPIIGLGGPVPFPGRPLYPNLGTQGLFWTVVVSTGYVGLFVFCAAWLRLIWETRRGPTVTFWCHVVLIIGFVQIFVYDMIPASLHIVFISAALGFRVAQRAHGIEPSADGRSSPVGAVA